MSRFIFSIEILGNLSHCCITPYNKNEIVKAVVVHPLNFPKLYPETSDDGLFNRCNNHPKGFIYQLEFHWNMLQSDIQQEQFSSQCCSSLNKLPKLQPGNYWRRSRFSNCLWQKNSAASFTNLCFIAVFFSLPCHCITSKEKKKLDKAVVLSTIFLKLHQMTSDNRGFNRYNNTPQLLQLLT